MKPIRKSKNAAVIEVEDNLLEHQPSDRRKTITLIALCLALFAINLDDSVMNVALPKIQTSLDSDVSGLQWILNAYTLPIASLVLPSGTLGDTYGRKRVFLGGLIIFTAASTLCGLAQNLEMLVAGRFIQGVGAAAIIPTSLSILTSTFPDPEEKTKAIGVWSSVSGIALVIGPALGGILVDLFGWQSVFWSNLPLGAIALKISLQGIGKHQKLRRQHLDLPGIILSVVMLACLTYALTEGSDRGWRSPLVIWLLILAILNLLLFLLVESRSSNPMLPLSLLKNPTFTAVNFANILLFYAFFSLLFIFGLFLQQVQNYSAMEAGLRFLPMNAAFICALLVSGWFAARWGWRNTIVAGLILTSISALSLIQINAATEYATIAINLIVSGFGGGLTLAPLAAAVLSSGLPSQTGIISAALNSSTRIGGILGIAIQGTILKQWLTWDLQSSVADWNLPPSLQHQLVANAWHHGSQTPRELPASISPVMWAQAFDRAFVSGMQATLIVAGIALGGGALLILLLMSPTAKKSD